MAALSIIGLASATITIPAWPSEKFPELQPEQLVQSPIPGLLEIRIGSKIAYLSADGRYLVQGEIIDLTNDVNVTAERRGSARRDVLAGVDEKDMVIFAPAKYRDTVTVFTDIDCGYCRRMHGEMAEYNKRGISVEYLFFPRSGVGGESYDKAVSVWCATDRNKAMDNAKAGGKLESKTCDNPVAADYELGQSVGVNGTPAVYTRDGTQLGGYLPPEQLLQHWTHWPARADPRSVSASGRGKPAGRSLN